MRLTQTATLTAVQTLTAAIDSPRPGYPSRDLGKRMIQRCSRRNYSLPQDITQLVRMKAYRFSGILPTSRHAWSKRDVGPTCQGDGLVVAQDYRRSLGKSHAAHCRHRRRRRCIHKCICGRQSRPGAGHDRSIHNSGGVPTRLTSQRMFPTNRSIRFNIRRFRQVVGQ